MSLKPYASRPLLFQNYLHIRMEEILFETIFINYLFILKTEPYHENLFT
jgi:hypothetical protein